MDLNSEADVMAHPLTFPRCLALTALLMNKNDDVNVTELTQRFTAPAVYSTANNIPSEVSLAEGSEFLKRGISGNTSISGI